MKVEIIERRPDEPLGHYIAKPIIRVWLDSFAATNDARDFWQAVQWAAEHGLIEPPELAAGLREVAIKVIRLEGVKAKDRAGKALKAICPTRSSKPPSAKRQAIFRRRVVVAHVMREVVREHGGWKRGTKVEVIRRSIESLRASEIDEETIDNDIMVIRRYWRAGKIF